MKISARFPDSSADFDVLILNFRIIWLFTAYMRIDTVYSQELTFYNYFVYLRYRHNVQAAHIGICMHEQSVNHISLKNGQDVM